MNDIEKLTELFRKLGAPEPERWARSQVQEGVPQLARFLFLRQAWKEIVGKHDEQWISDLQTRAFREDPAGDVVGALDRLLAQGASKQDLTTVVRAMQWRFLVDFCRLLDGPGEVEPEVRDMKWRLFQVDDESDKPMEPMVRLYESVLETAPKDDQKR
jgi:hypothetical protein